MVLARLRHVLVRLPDGAARAGPARLRLRLFRLPQPRHRGLSLDHHPGADLCADARLLPQRDGLRRQQRADRLPRRARASRFRPTPRGRRSSCCRGWRSPAGCCSGRAITSRSSARCWSAVRDAESRTRFLGYRVEHYKLFVFTVSAMLAGLAGRALRAAGRHHQSRRVLAGQLDRDRDLGGARRPRHAGRGGARRADRRGDQELADGGAARRLALSCWARCSSSSPSSCRRACSG